jgi:hypothetical protein
VWRLWKSFGRGQAKGIRPSCRLLGWLGWLRSSRPSVERAIEAEALRQRETAGGFGVQDAARLRFLKAWDAAGLPVETIGDLIVRGELPFSFMVAPLMGAHRPPPTTPAKTT